MSVASIRTASCNNKTRSTAPSGFLETTMTLHQVVQKATKAGGCHMTPTRKKSLFQGDSRLAKNVITATEHKPLALAIKEGVVSDHRVIEELAKAGVLATRIIVETEQKLGRKLPRSRAKVLVGNYLRIRADREGIENVRNLLAKLAKEAPAMHD